MPSPRDASDTDAVAVLPSGNDTLRASRPPAAASCSAAISARAVRAFPTSLTRQSLEPQLRLDAPRCLFGIAVNLEVPHAENPPA